MELLQPKQKIDKELNKQTKKQISKHKKRARSRDLTNWMRKQDVEIVAACCSWGGGAIFCIPCVHFVHFQTLLLGHKLSLAWIQVSGSLKQKVHQFFIPAFTGFLQIYVLFVNLQFVSQLFEWTVTIYETTLHENKSLCLLCHTKTINLSLAIGSLAYWWLMR